MGFLVISTEDRQPSRSMGVQLPDVEQNVTEAHIQRRIGKNWQRRGCAASAANFVRQTGIFISVTCLMLCQAEKSLSDKPVDQ